MYLKKKKRGDQTYQQTRWTCYLKRSEEVLKMEVWKELKEKLYPGDEQITEKKKRNGEAYTITFRSYDDYVNSEYFGNSTDSKLHLGLSPHPYAGNLERAKIFILSLNPGLHPGDYILETDPKFIEIHNKNMRQEKMEYPFYFLNPYLSIHPGYSYWFKKFRDLINEIKNHIGTKWVEAQKLLSGLVATLELVPYHSQSFGLTDSILGDLKSVYVMKQYVKTFLVPKAEKREILIIITRKIRYWDLNESDNVILYKSNETQSASLGRNSRAFKPMMEMIKTSIVQQ